MKSETVFVLLAGGASSRMGSPKGLLKYKDTFWILEQIKRVAKSNCKTIYIGLGFDWEKYIEEIPWFKTATERFVFFQKINVKVVLNERPELGSFSTLQAVLKKIDLQHEVLVNPIDTPILNKTALNKIIDLKNKVVSPQFQNRNGHPIKLAAVFWNPLLSLDVLEKNARLDFQIKKLEAQDFSIVPVLDDDVLKNINRKEEWEKYFKKT